MLTLWIPKCDLNENKEMQKCAFELKTREIHGLFQFPLVVKHSKDLFQMQILKINACFLCRLLFVYWMKQSFWQFLGEHATGTPWLDFNYDPNYVCIVCLLGTIIK